jgi:hypothetical protein
MQSMTGRQITGYPPRRIGELLCRTVHRRRSGTDGLLSACSFLAAESEAVAGFEKRQAGCGEQSQEISVGDVRFGDRTNGTATDEGKSGPRCLSHDYATDGFHSWTLDEVSQHQARHPIGTKARLALALLFLPASGATTWSASVVSGKGGWQFTPRKMRYKHTSARDRQKSP